MSAYPESEKLPVEKLPNHLVEQLSRLFRIVLSHETLHEMESDADVHGRELIRMILQAAVNEKSMEDRQQLPPIDSDGIVHNHQRRSSRSIMTKYGKIEIERLSWTSRKSSKGLRVLDAKLWLPKYNYSFGLVELCCELAVHMSYDNTISNAENLVAKSIPKRQMEESLQKAMVYFDSFYEERQELDLIEASDAGKPARTREDFDLLVLSSDAKGIVMRKDSLRPETQRRREKSTTKLETRVSPGEKKNRKRMAVVGVVYDLPRFFREPNDVISLNTANKSSPKKRTLRPTNKRVWASVLKDQHSVIDTVFVEAEARDPWHKRDWVYLVDGNAHQLNSIKKLSKAYEVEVTIIMDFIHVLEYLWNAAWGFFSKGDPAAEKWVAKQANRVLEGKASVVARAIMQSATKRNLQPKERAAVKRCRDYLVNHKEFLRYDLYLKKGYPIATGVIEGACRHLINDRLGITGARWSTAGAEAMLRLRSLRSSGDLDDYWKYYRKKELYANHLVHYADTELLELREAA